MIRTCFVYSGGVTLGQQNGSGGGKYNAGSPKQGSKRFNSITKTIHFAHLGTVYYLSMGPLNENTKAFLG